MVVGQIWLKQLIGRILVAINEKFKCKYITFKHTLCICSFDRYIHIAFFIGLLSVYIAAIGQGCYQCTSLPSMYKSVCFPTATATE